MPAALSAPKATRRTTIVTGTEQPARSKILAHALADLLVRRRLAEATDEKLGVRCLRRRDGVHHRPDRLEVVSM